MGELESGSTSGDPSRMRISDADRHTVAEVLRTAAGEGRLDLDELDERLELAFAAKTYADLVPITADLHLVVPTPSPVPRPRTTGNLPAGPDHAGSVAIMGDCKRQGAWVVPASHSAFALMGTVVIDLREATLSSPEITINASSIMGEVKVVVPSHFHVVVDGTAIMGEFADCKDKVAPEIGPGSPTIRVRGMALMGSVKVSRLPPRGTPKKIIGTY